MNTRISTKGRIVIPAELRKHDQIRPGQRFEIERVAAGEYLLKKQIESNNEGLVDWLLACPEKGWFTPICSESTKSLRR